MGVKCSVGCLFCRCPVRGVAQEEMSKLNPERGALGTHAGGFACGMEPFLRVVWDGCEL